MGYEEAIKKAWDEFCKLKTDKQLTVKFLSDEYVVDIDKKSVFSVSCNIPAKDYISIILLHYLAHSLKSNIPRTGKWFSFKELSAIEGYQAAFRKRVIEPIIRKYGKQPESLYTVLERFPGVKHEGADAAIVLEPLAGVTVLIELWGPDEEFGAEANILFDKSITSFFCTEDIIVFSEIIAHSI